MKIPNDNGIDYRARKFVEYQHEVPPIHQATLSQYVSMRNPTQDELVYIAWVMSNTYHELTTMLIFEEVWMRWNFNEFWKNNWNRIQFGTAKKYIKMNDRIVWIMEWFSEKYWESPYKKILEICWKWSWKERYENLIQYNKNCKNFWRFSSDLFNEIVMLFQKDWLIELGLEEPSEFDWKNCANLMSWTLNIMYEDDLADKYDRWDMSSQEIEELKPRLNAKIQELKSMIEERYGAEVDIPLFITKICSFRNLFKNARYWWYHHDRQLEYLIKYNREYPEKKELWRDVMKIRRKRFKATLLGEIGGWNGIRKERKKLWTTYWLTWVEWKH